MGATELVDSSQSADSSKSDSAVVDPRYVVRIEERGMQPGFYVAGIDTVDITINGFGKGIGGFDIKIGVDSADLQILEILPGELIDSCHWEFFTPRKKTNLPTIQLPLEVWQIIGLSQTVPDSGGPTCFGFDRPAILMRLVIEVESLSGREGTYRGLDALFLPIFFYWEDCTDNTFSTESGDTLCVSSRVFDKGLQEISGKRPLFPSRTGVPKQCINPSKANHPHKLVDFFNGGYFSQKWVRGGTNRLSHDNNDLPDSNQVPAESADTNNAPK